MKLSIKDSNWVAMLIFVEMFVKTILDNLKHKEKVVTDSETKREIKKIRQRISDILNYVDSVNTNISENLVSVLSWEKQGEYLDMLHGITSAMNRYAHNPKALTILLIKTGMATSEEIESEKKYIQSLGE